MSPRERSGRDRRLLSFPRAPGAFVMAIKAGVPVLPVAVRGTFQLVPKNTLRVTPGKAQLIIGTPISCEGKSIKDKENLRVETQRIVEKMFETGKPA